MDTGMQLNATAVLALFAEEMEDLGGTVVNTFEHAGQLYARSVMPRNLSVGPRDRVQGGVAVRFCPPALQVRPYVFRKVCSNGAIMAKSLSAWEVLHSDVRDPAEVCVELREAIRACADREVHEEAAELMRSARQAPSSPADLALVVAAMAGRPVGAGLTGLMHMIMGRFQEAHDPSRFGLMNAVTSVARDTPDPEQRWRLEELGGALAAGSPVPDPASLRGARSSKPMPVGAR